jgi:hypothetical protein
VLVACSYLDDMLGIVLAIILIKGERPCNVSFETQRISDLSANLSMAAGEFTDIGARAVFTAAAACIILKLTNTRRVCRQAAQRGRGMATLIPTKAQGDEIPTVQAGVGCRRRGFNLQQLGQDWHKLLFSRG